MDVIQKSIQLVENGHVDEAMTILSNYLKTSTDDEKIMIAELYMELGFFDEASELLEQILSIYPNDSELKVVLASIYIELEKDEKALNLLNEIDKDDPIYLQALFQLADLYESLGLYEVAEVKLMEAKEINPEEILIDFALGELLFSTGQYSRAVTFYEKVLQQEEEMININLIERVAECLAALGRYETALTYYEKLKSEHPDTLFKHGLTAYYSNRHNVAIQMWGKLIEIDPHYHTVYPELAKAFQHEGQLENALKTVKKGINIDEFNKELYLIASKIKLSMNNIKESEQYVREAIRLDTDYKEAILFLVELLKLNGDYDSIVDLMKEIKQSGAYDPDYDWELAKVYNELELYSKALENYKEAYSHLQHDSVFLKEYGYFLTEEGMVKEAISVLTEYMSIVPFDNDTEAFIERLRSTSND